MWTYLLSRIRRQKFEKQIIKKMIAKRKNLLFSQILKANFYQKQVKCSHNKISDSKKAGLKPAFFVALT
jgi:predicted secreted protein